ncbi:MAG: DUF354 domain-containing protein [Bacteroidales bacterium]|nr:DUF354 domain-containing protein [Bacteroidales bacterium]
MKIWIDITNTPHVNMLMPIIRYLKTNNDLIITARDFAETIPLLRQNDIEPIVFGEYKGKRRINKLYGLISRTYRLFQSIHDFDISLSLGGNYTASISRLKKKPSIVFSDNDISFKAFAYKFGTYFILPFYFNSDKIVERYGIKKTQIFTFQGFKEDIYIADFIPNPNFLDLLPFKDFITIRPENLKASYIPQGIKTIVPELFKRFKDINILFLPRYEEEKIYANDYSNIYIPDGPLNGLDVCYYSKAVLTGAGTFAREAALLGTPAVSFFPGKLFLTVDKVMQENGLEFKSRNASEIYKYVISSKKNSFKQARSKNVQAEVYQIIQNILNEYK